MTKSPKEAETGPEVEIDPEKAARFGEFIKRIAKGGPQHRKPKDQRSNSRRENAANPKPAATPTKKA